MSSGTLKFCAGVSLVTENGVHVEARRFGRLQICLPYLPPQLRWFGAENNQFFFSLHACTRSLFIEENGKVAFPKNNAVKTALDFREVSRSTAGICSWRTSIRRQIDKIAYSFGPKPTSFIEERKSGKSFASCLLPRVLFWIYLMFARSRALLTRGQERCVT